MRLSPLLAFISQSVKGQVVDLINSSVVVTSTFIAFDAASYPLDGVSDEDGFTAFTVKDLAPEQTLQIDLQSS